MGLFCLAALARVIFLCKDLCALILICSAHEDQLSFAPTEPPINSNVNVAFRLDEIQDWYCADAQIAVIKTFQQLKLPLTIGVIPFRLGAHQSHVDILKDLLKKAVAPLEVAANGFNFEKFNTSLRDQSIVLLKAKKKSLTCSRYQLKSLFLPLVL